MNGALELVRHRGEGGGGFQATLTKQDLGTSWGAISDEHARPFCMGVRRGTFVQHFEDTNYLLPCFSPQLEVLCCQTESSVQRDLSVLSGKQTKSIIKS